MSIIPPAEFAPDMPDLSEATNIATNVIALTPQSYGPINAIQPYSTNTLNSHCLGMGWGESDTLTHQIFAGTIDKLWCITEGSTNWVDVSGAVYATGADFWRFTMYKNLMIATQLHDPIQVFDMSAPTTFSDLSATAPHAHFVASTKNFLMVANTWDPVGGSGPFRVWWSGNGVPASWPTPGSALAQQQESDYNDFSGDQGQVLGLAPDLAGCDVAVIFERGIQRGIYVGPPDVFNFYPAQSTRGTLSSNSIVPFGSLIYYLGEDGFYAFDGSHAMPIGANKVDKWFFANVDKTAYGKVVGAADTLNKAIIWIFRSVHADTEHQDAMLIYRWDIQRWSYGHEILTEWIIRGPNLLSGHPTDRLLQITAIDNTHKLAYFTGVPMPAQIGTQVQQLTPGRRTFVNQTRPLVDTGSPSDYILTEAGLTIMTESGSPILTESDLADITVALSARNNYQESEVFSAEVPPDITGQCSFRSDGRYHRGRITISSGLWSVMAGLDVTGISAGTR